jgi:L-threonylcarbamoyladenylate synthase
MFLQKKNSKITCNTDLALNTLLNKGVLIFPSDTVFGIGCLPGNCEAYERIYSLKNRPADKRLCLYFHSMDTLKKWVYLKNSKGENMDYIPLLQKYLPGGYTFILNLCKKAKKELPLNYFEDTLGIRMPDCPALTELLKKLPSGIIAGTSANISGEDAVWDIKNINPAVLSGSDLALVSKDIEKSVLPKSASTVVDLVNKKILRQGSSIFDPEDFIY